MAPASHVDILARTRLAALSREVVRRLPEPERERPPLVVLHRPKVLPRVRDAVRHHPVA